ncbi:MAG: dihydroorotate dehydrogenase 2, partial [Alphaproteobacteria bacterium]
NTPGLRALQGRDALGALLATVRAARDELERAPPLLVKIAPDLAEADRADIARAMGDGAADGLIVGNTTITRPEGVLSCRQGEAGGLSGRPLLRLSNEILADMYRRTGGAVPLIGTGGIASGADAYAKIRAGASLVQIYTALVYQGPALIGRVKADMVRLLRADGFATIAEAVGADHA